MSASSIIGALRVNLGLDSALFTRGLRDSLRDMRGFGAKLGAAAGAAVAALSTMSITAINSAREIQNLSRLANSAPEEFQKIAYAANQVGINQEKFSDILKDVNDRVGDFIATGGGPMADFFERIAPKVGVTADQFRKLSGPQALQLYVDSLEKANVNQQDFTFFMEAMASDSTALLPILRSGGKLAQEYGDRLASLGGVMSNETVERLSAMKSSLTDVGVVLTGVKNTLGAAFAPVMQSLAQGFTSLMTEGSGLRLVFDGIAVAVSWMADVFTAVINIISHVVAGIWDLTSAGASWINQATGIGDAIKTIWDWTIGWVADIIVGVSRAISGLGGLGGAFSALKDIAFETWERIGYGLDGLENYFKSAGYMIAWAFTDAFAKILGGFASLTGGIANGWNALMESMGMQGNAKALGADLAASVANSAEQYWTAAKQQANEGFNNMEAASAPLESIAAINEKVAAAASEAAGALGNEPGGLGGGLEAAGGAAGGAEKKLSKFQEVAKSLREEAELLKATFGMSGLDAEIWAKQREAGVDALSAQGQQIAGTMTMIDRMKSLKTATEEWRDSIKSSFASFVSGASSFKDMLGQIIGKLAEMLANAAFDGLFNSIGGNGLVGGLLKMIGFDGGGYTGDAPRTGGLDGKGGFLAMMHPQETVIDHTRGQSYGGGSTLVEVVPSPYFNTVVDGRIQRASPAIIGGSVQATQRAARKSKTFFGGR